MNNRQPSDHLRKGEAKRKAYADASLQKIELTCIDREGKPGSQVVNDGWIVANWYMDRYVATGVTFLRNPRKRLEKEFGWEDWRAKKAWARFRKWIQADQRKDWVVNRISETEYEWISFYNPMTSDFLNPEDLPLYADEIRRRKERGKVMATARMLLKRGILIMSYFSWRDNKRKRINVHDAISFGGDADRLDDALEKGEVNDLSRHRGGGHYQTLSEVVRGYLAGSLSFADVREINAELKKNKQIMALAV